MSLDRDIDRVLDEWLSEGPLIARERVVVGVATRIQSQRQRHAPWLGDRTWRPASGVLAFAAIAAAAVVLIVSFASVLAPSTGPDHGAPGPGSSSSPASPTPRASPPPTLGPNSAPSPNTEVDAFDPGLRLALPDGWTITRDEYWFVEIEGPGGPGAGAISLRSGPFNPAEDAECDGAATASGVAAKTIETLAGGERLTVSAASAVELGGRTGLMVDVKLADAWSAHCESTRFDCSDTFTPPYLCPGGAPSALLLYRPSGPSAPLLGIAGNERMRLIILDLHDPDSCCAVAIAIHARDAATFDAFVRAATPVVESFEFACCR